MERSDSLLELTDESFAEIEPKHMDDVAAAWVLFEALNMASLSADGAAPEDLIRAESLASGCERIVGISVT